MASRAQLISYCGMVDRANSIDELRSIVGDYPELIYSQMGCASIMKAIPKLIERHDERDFDYQFIMTIINQYRCRAIGGYRDHVKEYGTLDGGSPHDWALNILRLYAREMIIHTEGACLVNPSVSKNFPESLKKMGIESPYVIIGYIFFIFDYGNANVELNDKAYDWFTRRFGYMEAMVNFLQTFADTCCAVSSDAIEGLARIACFTHLVDSDRHTNEYSPAKDNSFLYHCKRNDTGWLCDQLENYRGAEGMPKYDLDGDLMTEILNLFTMLSNSLQDRFITENFFYEYITEIAYYYPLIQQRRDIAERYEKYFGDQTFDYMATLTDAVYNAVSKVTDYKDPQQDRAATRFICMAVEDVMRDIHHCFPDVTPEVLKLFLDDTMKAFGRGFKGFSEGISWSVGDMIHKICESDKVTMESDFDCIELLRAMEAEDIGNDAGSDAVDNAALHRKASGTVNAAKNMKAAERKIFNAYHKYKSNEQKVDQTLAKGINALKKAVVGDQQKILIEGKPFSPIGFLKKVILTVGIFNYSKIAGILAIIVSKVMKGKAKKSEKRQLLMELEEELMMVNEKIEDARGDGNRQAKYDLMRTRNALQNAIRRLKYGIGAEEKKPQYNAERLRSTQNYEDSSLRG